MRSVPSECPVARRPAAGSAGTRYRAVRSLRTLRHTLCDCGRPPRVITDFAEGQCTRAGEPCSVAGRMAASAALQITTSERESAAELEPARATRTTDSTKFGVVDTQLGIVVVLHVQYVERLGTELHPHPLDDREILGQRHVDVRRGRASSHVQHVCAWAKRGVGGRTHGNSGEAGRIQVRAASGIAAVPPIGKHEVNAGDDIGPAAIDSRWLLDSENRAGSYLHDAGHLPTAEDVINDAVPARDSRKFDNERAVQTMPDVIAGRPAIEFRIPEVLIDVEVGSAARNVVRGEVATLRRLARAERVVDFPRVAVLEPLVNHGLQPVVEHRLAAVDVVAPGRSQRRVGPHARFSVEGLRELALEWEVTTVGAKVANFRGQRLTERALDADHRLNGVRNLHIRVEQREDASLASRVGQSERHGLIGVQRPLDLSGRDFRSVVDSAEGDERVRRALSDCRDQMRTVENADAAADDGPLVLVDRPRESGSWCEIVPIRLVRS